MNLNNLCIEDKFILNACSLNEIERKEALYKVTDSFDWEYFWEESNRNSVSGILYKHLKHTPVIENLVPFNIRQNLQQYYFQTLARNTRILRKLEGILKFLYQKGIHSIVLLKGAYLLPRVYKDVGARPMSDVDILLPNLTTVDKVFSLLVSGKKFTSKVYKSKWHVDFRKEITGKAPELFKDEIVIELHAPIAFNSLPKDWELIINTAKNFTIGSTRAKTLSDSLNKKLIDEHFFQHMDRKAFDLRMVIDRVYFSTYIGKHDGSLSPFLKNLSNNVEANRNVFLPVLLKKIRVLVKNRYFLRYCLSFFFPSYFYLKTNFQAKNSSYFNLLILYLIDFFRRFKK